LPLSYFHFPIIKTAITRLSPTDYHACIADKPQKITPRG
jgi:hypothetical protein